MNAPLLLNSRPAIDLDGQDCPALVRALLSLEVGADTQGLRRARLELAGIDAVGSQHALEDETLQWLDGRQLKLGSELRIRFGDTAVFSGRASRIAARFGQGELPVVEVQAEDRLWDLRQARHFQTWKDMDLAAIAEQVASRHGLNVQVDAQSPTWDVVQQWNETDLAFLRQLAARVGAELWLNDRRLGIAARAQRSAQAITLVQGNELIALDIDCDLAHQRSAVRVGGYDAQAKQAIDEAAGASTLGGLAAGGTSGLDALQQAFAERPTQRTHDTPLTTDEARTRAQAELRQRAQRFVTARGLAQGTAEMDVGSPLTLQRVGALFEGEGYVVAELQHRFDALGGFRTAFVAERGCILKGGA